MRQRIIRNNICDSKLDSNLLEMGNYISNPLQLENNTKKRIKKYFLINGGIVLFCLIVITTVIISTNDDNNSKNNNSNNSSNNSNNNNNNNTTTITIPSSTTPTTTIIIPDKYKGLKMIPNDNHICYNASNDSSYNNYTQQLDNFIIPYQDTSNKRVKCHQQKPQSDEACHIESTWIYPCGNGGWHYDEGNPCVILYYSSSSDDYKPIPYQNMTELLNDNPPPEVIEIAEEESEEGGSFSSDLVRLYCTHVDPYDYHPKGFYNFFFIYPKNENYLPPIVSVQFLFLDDDDNIITGEYNVTCTLWTKEPNVKEVKSISFKISQGKEC